MGEGHIFRDGQDDFTLRSQIASYFGKGLLLNNRGRGGCEKIPGSGQSDLLGMGKLASHPDAEN